MTLTEFLLARIAEDKRTCEQFRRDAPQTRLEQRLWAEVEAKRRIVHGNPARPWVLRVLAAVYSDHPDYREEWKP